MDKEVSHATNGSMDQSTVGTMNWSSSGSGRVVGSRHRLGPGCAPSLAAMAESLSETSGGAPTYTIDQIESMKLVTFYFIYIYILSFLIKQSPVHGCSARTNLLAVQVGGEESRVLGVRHDLGLDGVGIPIRRRRRHLSLYYCCRVLLMAMLLRCRRVGE